MIQRAEKRLTLTVPEAGELMGIGRNLAYEAARRGEIPTIKIGSRIVVPRAAFEEMLKGGAAVDRSDPDRYPSQ